MSDYLDLYDYRQRVFALYNERNTNLLAREDHETTWLQFRKGRDELFAHHPQSALAISQRQAFTGLPYFPYNPTLRFTVEIDPASEPIKQTITMNATETMSMTTVGYIHLTIEHKPIALAIYWLDLYGGGLFLPFRDATCPDASYGGGRYLFDTIKGSTFLPLPDTTGSYKIMLDFNYTYNPSCAYNDAWVCPLAPLENRLTVPVQAGELKYK